MIYETIITSVDAQGNAHVTPFGIRYEQGLIVIAPYKPSATLDNILATEHAVLNLTDDVRVFAGALTSRQAWTLDPTEEIVGFRLADTLVHKELKLVKVKQDALRPQLFLEVVHEVQHQPFQGFNRAQAAVIELAVLVSRLKRLPMEKIEQEMDYLAIAIEKTAGTRELEAWEWLVEAVTNHQAAMNAENIA
ncbi:MAG: DUF447 domain-containing protein [Methylotenera sp.]